MPNHSEELLTAIVNGELKEVIKLAAELPDEIKNTLRDNDQTPVLCLAIDCLRAGDKKSVEIVEELIYAGYPVNLSNRHGDTPLHLAVKKRHAEIVELLIEEGADIHAENRRRKTPVDFAVGSDIKLVELYNNYQIKCQTAEKMKQQLMTGHQSAPTPPTAESLPAAEKQPMPSQPLVVSREHSYYQNALLFEKFRETLGEIKKTFFNDAIRNLRHRLGDEYLFKQEQQGDSQPLLSSAFKPSVFISYAQEKLVGQWIKENLYVNLFEDLGCHVYFDAKNMYSGMDFAEFEEAIFKVTHVIAAATPWYFAKYQAWQLHDRQVDLMVENDEDMIPGVLYLERKEAHLCYAIVDPSVTIRRDIKRGAIDRHKLPEALFTMEEFTVPQIEPFKDSIFKITAQRGHTKERARSGVSDEMAMIGLRLNDPKLRSNVVCMGLAGEVVSVEKEGCCLRVLDDKGKVVYASFTPDAPALKKTVIYALRCSSPGSGRWELERFLSDGTNKQTLTLDHIQGLVPLVQGRKLGDVLAKVKTVEAKIAWHEDAVYANATAEKSLFSYSWEPASSDLHFVTTLPQTLSGYRRSYLLVGSEHRQDGEPSLHYVNRDGKLQGVTVADGQQFWQQLTALRQKNADPASSASKAEKITLSKAQFHELITANGGHRPQPPIEGGFQYFPASLTGKFGMVCSDNEGSHLVNYCTNFFHFLKTLYQIPEHLHSELERHEKLFAIDREIIYEMTPEDLAPYKEELDKASPEQLKQLAREKLTQRLKMPKGSDAKDPDACAKYARTEEDQEFERLLRAVQQGHTFVVMAAGKKEGTNLSRQDALGNSVYHYSARTGNTEICRYLSTMGVDINVQNHVRNTPISEAAVHGQAEAVMFMVENGADVTLTNRNEQTPFERFTSEPLPKSSDHTKQAALEKMTTQIEVALLAKEAHQREMSCEALLTEKMKSPEFSDSSQKLRLNTLQKRLTQTRSLPLTVQHEDLGQLNFGLSQGGTDADSALRCLLEEERYGKPSEPFKRDVLIEELKETINKNTPKAKSIKNLILRDMTAHYQAYHAELWQPTGFFPVNLKQLFDAPREGDNAPIFSDTHMSDYLNYLATRQGGEAEPLMVGGFLDAVAALSNQPVYYWQEQQGVLTCIHTFKPLQTEGKSQSPKVRHLLHQGIYFDELKPQAHAGVLVTARDSRTTDLINGAVNEKLTIDYRWLLELSYYRWENAKQQGKQEPLNNETATSILQDFERLIWFEAFVLYWDWQLTEKSAANQPTSQAKSDLTPKPKPATPKLSESKHTITPPPKTYCDQVREKALSVADRITTQEFKEIMRAASHFEPDKVKAMLDKNPNLIYAQGDFNEAFEKTKDGQDKIYKNITLFQYLWIIGDIKLGEAVMKYFSSEPKLRDAAIQALALDERKDIELFSYDDTIAQYKNYETNYSKWDDSQRRHHWQKGVGGAQLTWPGYLVAQFTEVKADNNTSWTLKTISVECLRVTDSRFGGWSDKIISGGAWTRGVWREAFHKPTVNPGSGTPADYYNVRLRGLCLAADRSRLSTDFRNQLSQEYKRITSDFDWQQPPC